ncbi:hypothetical protein A0H81_08359 [Grifola frondosa]|uniref:RGS domain-containing protein n=1 Tax=Grifola frondosa TaxID=5627 RepID=A0A1C7M4D3_GRIFR|nr:hypothetical protein A0H81_08359 [Grifola frondosa]
MSSLPIPVRVPSAVTHPQPAPPPPNTIKLSPKALLSLPYRLTHPPPPTGKLTSWGVTPHFDISLDDIVNRKHLPPLGLKDFEEWLLFVERAPENLYFILWLRDYTARYNAWARQSKRSTSARVRTPAYRTLSFPAPPPNPALAHFFLRAKHTFLAPHAPYELPVPSDVLQPFHTASLGAGVGGPLAGTDLDSLSPSTTLSVAGSMTLPPPPPDPAVFAELAECVREMLDESLSRFVIATYHNVGMPRAHCGCAGGIVIAIIGSAPPLVANFATGGSRWWRIAALPGMWLGLTILISAFYGVCMMIYVFGDLRQLRSFELARLPGTNPTGPAPHHQTRRLFWRKTKKVRPEISAPLSSIPIVQPITRPPKARLHGSLSMSVQSEGEDEAGPSTSRFAPPKLRIIPPPAPAQVRSRSSASSHASSESDEYTDDSEEDSDEDGENVGKKSKRPRIEISDAYYDEHPSPEGPATTAFWSDYADSEEELVATAAFIRPYAYDSDSRRWGLDSQISDVESQTRCSKISRLRGDTFDFDGLPPRRPRPSPSGTRSPLPSPPLTTPVLSADVEKGQDASTHTKCGPANVAAHFAKTSRETVHDVDPSEKGTPVTPVSSTIVGSPRSPTLASSAPLPPCAMRKEDVRVSWRMRFRRALAVPAFASPLTPVLNPIVTRAQWEIVVRSALMALVVSCVVIAGLVGAPET